MKLQESLEYYIETTSDSILECFSFAVGVFTEWFRRNGLPVGFAASPVGLALHVEMCGVPHRLNRMLMSCMLFILSIAGEKIRCAQANKARPGLNRSTFAIERFTSLERNDMFC